MAQYKEFLDDGTVRIVRYNPHHDGPVSEYITASNTVRFFQRRLRRSPDNLNLRRKLAEAQRALSLLELDKSASQRPQKRNWHSRLNQNNGRNSNRSRQTARAQLTSQTSKANRPLDTDAASTTLATPGLNLSGRTPDARQRESTATGALTQPDSL